ncbi:hypothetical protein KR032_009735 [Drosophila birchii]|nr:hypothetical protein KR032_009735 [Drosophila birchii]
MERLNSEAKKIQKKEEIPGRIMLLLKPVPSNPFSASPKFNWFMINRLRTRQRRYYFNMSRHPRHLPKVLATVLEAIPYSTWHNFFLLMPSKNFRQWRKRFPMATIIAKEGKYLKYPTDPRAFRRKLKGSSGSKKENSSRRQIRKNKT